MRVNEPGSLRIVAALRWSPELVATELRLPGVSSPPIGTEDIGGPLRNARRTASWDASITPWFTASSAIRKAVLIVST
ncbi:MAG: hypothetical protein Aurels2KO_46260 [Aureliella sp.]